MSEALDGRSVELHLDQGILCAVFVNDAAVHEIVEVHKIVQNLVSQASGGYNFNFNSKVMNHHFSLPITPLIRETIETAQVHEQQLPHQGTQFKSVLKLPAIPQGLRSNWMMLRPLLSKGASAEDVNHQFQLGVVEARRILYRLRAAGLIEPQRAIDTHVSQPSRKSVVRNLLHTLQRLTKRGAV